MYFLPTLIHVCYEYQLFHTFQVVYGWRKVTNEFKKRLDPTLPFHYYTSAHSRFYEDEMPDFNVQPSRPRQPRRPPQRELLGASGHVTLAVRGEGSLRT